MHRMLRITAALAVSCPILPILLHQNTVVVPARRLSRRLQNTVVER